MSFPTDVTINDGTTDHVYSQISLENSRSVRSDATKSLGEPSTLVISHETKGSGLTAVDRHLIRINDTLEDTGADSVDVLTGSVYLVIEKPRRVISEALTTLQVNQITTFCSNSANLAKILNGEP